MIEKKMIYITPFNTDRMLHIYLPDDYYANDKHYPVLYMFDGHNLYLDSDATYGRAWRISDHFTNNHVDMIVVGLECNHEGRERLSEFCPYVLKGSWLGDLDGRGTPLMEWMAHDLVAWTNANYRTTNVNYIGGSSMGGLMSAYAIIAYPEVYTGAACLSSSLGLCHNELIAEVAKHQDYSHCRVYFTTGTEENKDKYYLAGNIQRHSLIQRALENKGAHTYMNIVMNGQHNEATWDTNVMDFINYLVYEA